ncbi:MAG: ATP-binding cassette domain-containing protein [Gammaproteobacteria bacterium]|nr:ATP-binding cassette domain-containing protein [Gammaproteobacteria bacterium]
MFMEPIALIQVENLSRFYQNHRAINQLSFTLNAGEVLGFLGPNGAGKSTTMQIITGNLAPSEGEVSINGFDIIESPRDAKAQIGYLPEHPPVYRDASVDEYLKYCAQLRRVSKSAISRAISEVKASCGLEEVEHRLIGNLSKGFQQRVGIAQAIIHNPPVVILDEPTVGLDPIQIREIRSLIKNLGEQRSVILSTHILSEVQATCDRVQIIREGELIYSASIEALNRGNESSVSVALKRPPSTEILQQLDHVSHVEQKDEQRFHVFFDTCSPAEIIVEQAVAHDWGLFELMPDQQSLEDLFIELTRQPEAETRVET